MLEAKGVRQMTDNELAIYIHQVHSLMARESDQRLLEQLGIGLAQYKILAALHAAPKPQQRAIASELGQTEASISRQIKLLEGKGMLVATKNPANMREHHITLTARGLQLIEAAERVISGYHHGTFAGLSKKQRQQLEEALAVLQP